MIGTEIGHYRIIEKLGEGGMGEVWLAEDTSLERRVALKLLPKEAAAEPSEKNRFFREAKAASALDHANICTVFEVSETDQHQPYIAMAYCDGETIREKIARGPLKLDEALDIAIQIGKGLSRAHSEGIVHRDIKPANAIQTSEGVVKIVDFGLAKLAGASKLTQTGTTMGTVAYMSPEQVRGESVDHRADIWALGVLLYEMVTGRIPFESDHEQGIVYSILQELPEPVTAIRARVPLELDRILEKVLRKDRTERYQSIEDLQVDLRSLQKDLESGSVAAPTLYPVQKITSRRLVRPVSLATVLVVGIVGTILLLGRQQSTITVALLPPEVLMESADTVDDTFIFTIANDLVRWSKKTGSLAIIWSDIWMHAGGPDEAVPFITDTIPDDIGALLRLGISLDADSIHVSQTLIDRNSRRDLWTRDINEGRSNIESVYRDILLNIAENKRITLGEDESTALSDVKHVNKEVHALFGKGLNAWKRFSIPGFNEATRQFQAVTELDPENIQAHAMLSLSYSALIINGFQTDRRIDNAHAAYRRALELALKQDFQPPELYLAAARIQSHVDWEWTAAEDDYLEAFRRHTPDSYLAIETLHMMYSQYLAMAGRPDEALARAEHALELNGLSITVQQNLAWMNFRSENYEKAINQYTTILNYYQLLPDLPITEDNQAHAVIAQAMAYMGNTIKAMEYMKKRNEEDSTEGSSNTRFWIQALMEGMSDSITSVIDTKKEQGGIGWVPFTLSWIQLAAGDTSGALSTLEQMYENGDRILALANGPMYKSIRNHPRYRDLLRKMNFPQ